MKTMKPLFFLLIIFYFSSQNIISQDRYQYDGVDDIRSALTTLKGFPTAVNRSGWNDTYRIKSYYNIMEKAERSIDNATDHFSEAIELIEKAEKKNYDCLSEGEKAKVNDILYDLKKLKRALNSAIDDLYDVETSEVSARLYTIYKNPGRTGYKRAVIPEIEMYFNSSFNDLKSIHNHLVKLSKNYTYFNKNLNYINSNLLKRCN